MHATAATRSTFAPSVPRLLTLLAALGSPWLLSASLWAAPTISDLSVRGLTPGKTTQLVITGSDLLPNPQLVLPVPIASQQVMADGTAKRVTLEVSLPADTPPGLYPLRIVTDEGISAATGIAIDSLPQQPVEETITTLPIALHGALTGSQLVETTVVGKRGQRLVVDVESRRLGSSLQPIVRLFDQRGTQLAWSDARPLIASDARLEAVLPETGTYRVQLHDAIYKGAAPGFFRLKLGDLRYADLTLPLGVERGKRTSLDLVSANFPANVQLMATLDGQLGETAPAPLPATATGAAPVLTVSPFPELRETPTKDDTLQTLPAAPVAVSGRIATEGEEDRYLLSVVPGSKLRVELFAARLGSPLDGVLTVRGEAGNQLAASDDQAGTSDPGLNYTVPAKVERVVLSVQDLVSQFGDSCVYRLVVTPQGAPDFSLSVASDQQNVPAGGALLLEVTATRRGYQGPIALELVGAPAGVTVTGNEIAAGSDKALLTLSAAANVTAHGLAQLVGKAKLGEREERRLASGPGHALSAYQPWLAHQLAVATAAPGPIEVQWEVASPVVTAAQGEPVLAKVRLTRAEKPTGPVRLRLLTNHPIPQKEVPDPKDNKKKIKVDDLAKTLRFAPPQPTASETDAAVDGTLTLEPEWKGTEPLSESLTILAPAEMPAGAWDVVIQAELLSPDKKTVVATAVTTLRQLALKGK